MCMVGTAKLDGVASNSTSSLFCTWDFGCRFKRLKGSLDLAIKNIWSGFAVHSQCGCLWHCWTNCRQHWGIHMHLNFFELLARQESPVFTYEHACDKYPKGIFGPQWPLVPSEYHWWKKTLASGLSRNMILLSSQRCHRSSPNRWFQSQRGTAVVMEAWQGGIRAWYRASETRRLLITTHRDLVS